jgi:hypothetical protein
VTVADAVIVLMCQYFIVTVWKIIMGTGINYMGDRTEKSIEFEYDIDQKKKKAYKKRKQNNNN